MDTCKRMWSKDELAAASGKTYIHSVYMTTSAFNSTLKFLSSSNDKITFDTLAANTNGEWQRFIFGTVTKTSGDYVISKVSGMKITQATEVYLYPVDQTDPEANTIIIDSDTLTSFSDVIVAL